MGSGSPRHDYLIVFGASVRSDGAPSGTLRRRIAAAYRMAQAAGPVRFLVTGGVVQNPPSEALVMRRLLLELGAADDQILIEDQARNTYQSAVLCAEILRGRDDVGAVVVCTSRYHIPRCRMLLRMHGIRPSGSVASEDAAFVGRLGYVHAWIRELVAVSVDAVVFAWRRLTAGPRH